MSSSELEFVGFYFPKIPGRIGLDGPYKWCSIQLNQTKNTDISFDLAQLHYPLILLSFISVLHFSLWKFPTLGTGVVLLIRGLMWGGLCHISLCFIISSDV
jgi:hypothetical protein